MTTTPSPLFPGSTPSRIGTLDSAAGYPSTETTQRLFDELDFQRAVQGYLWAIPYVGFGQWQNEHEEVFGAQDGAALTEGLRFYPADRLAGPPANRLVRPEGREWSGTQPRGLAYWEVVSRLVAEEPVHDRDRIVLAMLEHLGIVKGRPFTPDDCQRKILEEAAVVGEAMARAIGFEPRFEGATVYPGRDWKLALVLDASQETEHTTQLDERTAWFYEAVTSSKGMTTTTPGQGQVYLHVGRDAHGAWLTGDHAYELTVPVDAPVEQFWSFTVYDADTRCFVDNPHEWADRSSRDPLAVNDDGSVTLHIAARPPASCDANWIPTTPGRGWFGYFRLYAPSAAYFDRTWQLPDIRRVD